MASYSQGAPVIEDEISTWLQFGESGSLEETNANVQLNQYEAPGASVQTDIGGQLTEAQIAQKRKKKESDDKFKKKLKEKNEFLQGLVPGCSEVTGQVPKLDTIINYVQSLQYQVEEAAKQTEENKQLNGKQLQHRTGSPQIPTEIVSVNATSLMPEEGIPLPNEESQLNSTEAHRDACFQVQEIIPHKTGRERSSVLPSNKEVIRGTCGSDNESDEPSAFDGISGEPSAKVLGSNKRKRSVDRLRMKRSSSHHISNGDVNAANTDILKKLEADDESTVGFSDFNGLDGEHVKFGKYNVPRSIYPTAKKIFDIHGDVTVGCKMNQWAKQTNYILFCAAVKEMSSPRVELVTENRILKWRDAIKDALRSDFNVEFAMDRLKEIARAYINLREHTKLVNEALGMSTFMDAAEESNDN